MWCCMGLPFHVFKKTCFSASTFPGVLSTTWMHPSSSCLLFCSSYCAFSSIHRFGLCLLHSSRDLTHVVLHGGAFSCVQENLFLCKHLPWCLVHQLDALFIFLLELFSFRLTFRNGGFGLCFLWSNKELMHNVFRCLRELVSLWTSSVVSCLPVGCTLHLLVSYVWFQIELQIWGFGCVFSAPTRSWCTQCCMTLPFEVFERTCFSMNIFSGVLSTSWMHSSSSC
jgi:hypothetical protein